MRSFLPIADPDPKPPRPWTFLRKLAWLVLFGALGYWALIIVGSPSGP